MLNKTVGPYNNPFKATIEALAEANIGTAEFTSFRAWDAIGYYDFHTDAANFIKDTVECIRQFDVIVSHEDDGFYAIYIGE